MKYIQLNIDSTKPFYTDNLGHIYNQYYRRLKCSETNDSLFLAYVHNDGTKRKESIARLIYQTFNPTEDLTGYNIFKSKECELYPYKISNLIKVKQSDMPDRNACTAIHYGNK